MKRNLTLIAVLAILAVYGCSSGGSAPLIPTLPDDSGKPAMASGNASHCIWGLWQFTADPVAGTLDVVQLRMGNLHLNALPFLEPPPYLNLTLESGLHFQGEFLDVDIGLRHPFLGLTQYTGFDACGILITNGSLSGFEDEDLVVPWNEEDTYLANPDGYSPWWNPVKFPPNQAQPIFGYVDGLLGIPDAVGNYNATACGYKYFADGLEPDDGLEKLDFEKRGMFSVGQKNIRHYTIHIGDEGLVFNYAVDASWKFPEGPPPWEAPGSFSLSANRPESFYVSVAEIGNTLYYINDDDKGGTLSLHVTVYDWQGPSTIHSVGVEWPGIFPYEEKTKPFAETELSATYLFELSGDNLTSTVPVDIFITAKDVEMHPAFSHIPFYWGAGGFKVSGEPQNVLEERIVYAGGKPGGSAVGGNVFTIDPEGLTEPKQWTFLDPSDACEGPVLSPNGQYIVYARFEFLTSELRRIDVITGDDISLTGGITSGLYWFPSWRNDGAKIVYSYSPDIFDFELYTMDPDGTNKELTFPTGLDAVSPVYSPDDQYVHFASFYPSELYTLEIATGESTQYTNNGVWNDDPDPSPGGEYIAWATSYPSSGGRKIYISPIDSWDPAWKIISFEQYFRHPSFSPDGTRIAYSHGAYGGAEIAVYDLTDDTWYDLTNDDLADNMADWGMMIITD